MGVGVERKVGWSPRDLDKEKWGLRSEISPNRKRKRKKKKDGDEQLRACISFSDLPLPGVSFFFRWVIASSGAASSVLA